MSVGLLANLDIPIKCDILRVQGGGVNTVVASIRRSLKWIVGHPGRPTSSPFLCC